jgi:hypothetical protein
MGETDIITIGLDKREKRSPPSQGIIRPAREMKHKPTTLIRNAFYPLTLLE